MSVELPTVIELPYHLTDDPTFFPYVNGYRRIRNTVDAREAVLDESLVLEAKFGDAAMLPAYDLFATLNSETGAVETGHSSFRLTKPNGRMFRLCTTVTIFPRHVSVILHLEKMEQLLRKLIDSVLAAAPSSTANPDMEVRAGLLEVWYGDKLNGANVGSFIELSLVGYGSTESLALRNWTRCIDFFTRTYEAAVASGSIW